MIRCNRIVASGLFAAMFLVQSAGAQTQGQKAVGLAPVRAAETIGDQRYALVIGVDEYQDRGIPTLHTCESDASALYKLLTDSQAGGVDPKHATLLLGKQATAQSVRDQLDSLSALPANALIFVYFSGHGARKGETAYWVLHDTSLEKLGSTGLDDFELQHRLGTLKDKRLVVMLDCCYAAATIGEKALAGTFVEAIKQFAGKGQAFLMAAAENQTAIEANDLHRSLFSYYLIEGLGGQADANGDGVVTLSELTQYLDDHVGDAARQRGGGQKPVTRIDVQEPGRFLLTINPKQWLLNQEKTSHEASQRKALADKLMNLYLNKTLSEALYKIGRPLFECPKSALGAEDQEREKYYEDFLTTHLLITTAEQLERAVAAVMTPEELAAAQARLKVESEQKQQKIAQLLATAKANATPENADKALAALDEILALQSDHAEALELRQKISSLVLSITNQVGMKMVRILPGTFLMGSPANETPRGRDEVQHRVTLSRPFYIAATVTTQKQWRQVMKDLPNAYQVPNGPLHGDDFAVQTVCFDEAIEFCQRLSKLEGRRYRLPTEAEWEFAWRAGNKDAYPAGGAESMIKYAWFLRNCKLYQPVATRQPNPWGLYDMMGNVSQWCNDFYGPYPNADQIDPIGPPSGPDRVIRGGNYQSDVRFLRAAFRDSTGHNRRDPLISFRCVLEDGPAAVGPVAGGRIQSPPVGELH